MVADDLRALLYARPFVAFTIHVADGREFHVPTPEHAHVLPKGNRVDAYTDEGRSHFLPTLLISGVSVDANVHSSDS